MSWNFEVSCKMAWRERESIHQIWGRNIKLAGARDTLLVVAKSRLGTSIRSRIMIDWLVRSIIIGENPCHGILQILTNNLIRLLLDMVLFSRFSLAETSIKMSLGNFYDGKEEFLIVLKNFVCQVKNFARIFL